MESYLPVCALLKDASAKAGRLAFLSVLTFMNMLLPVMPVGAAEQTISEAGILAEWKAKAGASDSTQP